jgi:hypothetical protein
MKVTSQMIKTNSPSRKETIPANCNAAAPTAVAEADSLETLEGQWARSVSELLQATVYLEQLHLNLSSLSKNLSDGQQITESKLEEREAAVRG